MPRIHEPLRKAAKKLCDTVQWLILIDQSMQVGVSLGYSCENRVTPLALAA